MYTCSRVTRCKVTTYTAAANGARFTAYRHFLPADVQVNLLGAMYACTSPHLGRDAASQSVLE